MKPSGGGPSVENIYCAMGEQMFADPEWLILDPILNKKVNKMGYVFKSVPGTFIKRLQQDF